MSTNRKIGYNISLLLRDQGKATKDLCDHLNFAQSDINKLLNGRLGFNPQLLNKLSEFFSVPVTEILRVRSNDEYAQFVQCMSEFSDKENCDRILDIIDTYIDLCEAKSICNV